MQVDAGLEAVAVHRCNYQSVLGVVALDHDTFHHDRTAAGGVRKPFDVIGYQIRENR